MQKTWFCVHLYLGTVVLMGVFVFPDPDPDLSGGAGLGAGPSSLPGPGPRTRPKLFPPGRRACWIRGDLRSTAGGSGAIPCGTAPPGEELVAVLPPFTSASTPPRDPGRPMSKSKAIPLHSVGGVSHGRLRTRPCCWRAAHQ